MAPDLAHPGIADLSVAASGAVAVAPGEGKVLRDAVRVATTSQLPLELGSLEVTEDGRVAPRPVHGALSFSFVYRGLPVSGEIDGEPNAKLRLTCQFGKLPYTAELPHGRRRVREMVAESQRTPRARFEVTRSQDVRLSMEIAPPRPRTPVGLVAAIAAVLLDARPKIAEMTAALASSSRRPA
jgi:hypothetical protein